MIKLTNQQKEDIDAIAWHFGDERAVLHAGEEYAEASAAIVQYFRAEYHHDGFPDVRFDLMCEEIADAFIMLEELLDLHPEMRAVIEQKIEYKIEDGERYRDRLIAARDAGVRLYGALSKGKPTLNADLQMFATGLDIAIEAMALCDRWEYEAAVRKGLMEDGLPDVIEQYDRDAIAEIYGLRRR